METVGKIVIAFIIGIALAVVVTWSVVPARKLENKIDYTVNKVDEETRYSLLKSVEDTCRAMIASYQSDALTYNQYKNNPDIEKQNWAEQARMRANRTATTYNEYMRKNSYVWANNIPADIDERLEYVE